jgi:hypothetical protein
MNLNFINEKLNKLGCAEGVVDSIILSIEANINSFTFANESLEILAIYLVFQNTGGYKLFKTLNGQIILDKLDTSYSESRELLGVGSWNIKTIYKVSFESAEEVIVKKVSLKDVRKILFSVVEPIAIKYVLGIDGLNYPALITVDTESYNTLKYKDLKHCVFAAYKRILSVHEESRVQEKETSYYVVGYTLSEQ